MQRSYFVIKLDSVVEWTSHFVLFSPLTFQIPCSLLRFFVVSLLCIRIFDDINDWNNIETRGRGGVWRRTWRCVAFFRIFIINKFSEYISVHHGILQRRFSSLMKPSSAWTSFFNVLRSLCKRLYVASIPTLSNWANESTNLAIAYVPLCVNKLPQKIGQSSLISLFHHTEKKTKKRKWKHVTVK